MTQFFLFIFGASLGSLINVLTLRYHPDKSFWRLLRSQLPNQQSTIDNQQSTIRSCCPHCRATLRWFELIPIVSFLIQAGRCRSCKKPISWQYPIVEGLTGGLAVGLGAMSHIGPIGLIGLISLIGLIGALLTIALIDLRTTIISDELIIIALILTFLIFLTSLTGLRMDYYSSRLFGLLIGGGFLSAFWLAGRGRWMGLGDGKLGAVLGLWLGYPLIFLALAVAFVSGTIIAVALLANRHKTLKDTIPFGPFLIFGALVAFFSQGWFLSWWRLLY